MIEKLKQILNQYWGTTSFRPLQLDIIQSVLTVNDTLALMPTGGGKSVCYQVPALYLEGMCIVVSPLIALMKDQVESLRSKKIPAAAVFTGMSYTEIENTLNNAAFGQYKLLYVSPERLQTESFRLKVEKMPVSLLAVDEAHCISEWGYDFRPAYLEIANIREYLPEVPVLALTATATPEVRQDIISKLNLKNVKVFEKSFNRENLIYAVVHSESKYNSLLSLVKKIPGSGIVYGKTRKQVVESAQFLRQNKISADYYHAGLDTATRNKKQDEWKKGKTRIIVATNAFGMGIDKENVRFVIHLHPPDSLEAYYQEAGRAGRDFNKSYAVLLSNLADKENLLKRTESIFPEKSEVHHIYEALCNFLRIPVNSGSDLSFDFDFNEFCNRYNLEPAKTTNCLQFFVRENLIYFPDKEFMPSRLMILVSYKELYDFQIINPKFEPVVKALLRSYEGLFDLYVKINEKMLAKMLDCTEEVVVRLLKMLSKMDVIDYIPSPQKPQIVFLHDRVEKLELGNIYLNLQKRKESFRKRIESVVRYAFHHNTCRSRQLLGYFGEKLTKDCGHCDFCLKTSETGMTSEEFEKLFHEIKSLLRSKKCSFPELSKSLNINEKKLRFCINWLTQQGILYENNDKNLELLYEEN
ncbi:MAG TPA: ATP-dependent DNA helicase RecQ [Bacteroidia bacterium]|nr:ATP-dependent DNA helicase RecQ [Bacteroidia bacterium]HRS58085.1 ATP-dependent DNA helicase RecQ [Bacteroidia bacterium]HRU66894.1 ATP-dependent DNA helicase RecQ [Bacteroidia bacterium]